MTDPRQAYETIIGLLDAQAVEYALFHHRPILTYEDAAAVANDAGFGGVEGKCLVLNVDGRFAVYTTLAGARVDFKRIRAHLGARKVRLATADELRTHFGAEPGNAYPFGFAADVRILVDPALYALEWVLFSPALHTATIQVRGADLPRVFRNLPNSVDEAAFNL